MSSAFNRGDSRPAPQSESPAKEPAAEPAVGARMLDQILALMAGGSPEAGFVEPDDLRAIREVAKNLAGQPFSRDPVVSDLIHAILQVQFQKAQIPSTSVRAMAQYIANTLYDDPPSRQRLETMWASLSQS
jgi:hypothetical protein